MPRITRTRIARLTATFAVVVSVGALAGPAAAQKPPCATPSLCSTGS